MFNILAQDYVHLSRNHPVRWQQRALIEAIGPHSHAFTELVMIKHGPIPHRIFSGAGEVQQIELKAGDFLVIPPGPVHGYGSATQEQNCQLINICYLAEWFLWDLSLLWSEGLVPLFFASHLFRRLETLQIWHFHLSNHELRVCERELEDIEFEYQQLTPSLLFIRGAFFKILVVLARAWHRQVPQGDLHFRPEVWRALQAIDQDIKEGQSFRVDAFAREVGLAPGSFSRLFNAATGFSPSEYFGRRRTQHAAHLLLESDLSIGEIATRLGFCDSAHLSRAFLHNQQLSPRAFRARYRRAD